MTITSTSLTRAAGIAAAAAGAIFIGVQINHPHLDATTIASTEMVIRGSLKVAMAALALVGITGMYVSQICRNGLLGLVGYVVLAAGYVTIFSTSLVGAYVLPHLAETNPGYVDEVVAVATGRTTSGDIGALQTVFQFQGYAYLVGGLLLGIALYRAHVLNRWATALLAVGGLVSAVLHAMPDAFYRFLAFPNGIAMIVLGWSLWSTARGDRSAQATGVPSPRVTAGAA
jgi:hypothetical protein